MPSLRGLFRRSLRRLPLPRSVQDREEVTPVPPRQCVISSSTDYTYKPLDVDASSIRVLTLHSSSDFSAVLEITIHIQNLSPTEKLEYEALSYAWGSHEEPLKITVRSTVPDTTYTLSVTRSLDEALRYLRLADVDRLLWVDAICINQNDNKEKGFQVGRMGDIYARATRVIAWLGPEEILEEVGVNNEDEAVPGTALAIKALSEWGQKIEVDWSKMQMSPKTVDDDSWADLEVVLPYNRRIAMSLDCLFQKSWFERLWVWQEIRLGNVSSLLMCGYSSISWSSFRRSIYLLYLKRPPAGIDPVGFGERLSPIWRLCDYNIHTGKMKLEDILFNTQHCKFTDSRDRVFALLGLVDKDDREDRLVPDYSKTLEEVFKNVVLKFINYEHTLKIMSYCNLPVEGLRNTKLPTWVPDWTMEGSGLAQRRHAIQYADANTPCCCHRVGYNELAVTGVKVAVIKETTSPEITQSITIHELITKLASADILEGIYVGGGSILDAYSKTWQMNIISERFLPPHPNWSNLDLIRNTILKIISKSGNIYLDSSVAEEDLFVRMRHVIHQHQYFTTQEGYMGFAPHGAQAGDHIAIFLGLNLAMVLRLTTNQQKYQIVGPCYIHGFMQAEAILGPMPEHFEIVLRHNENTSGYWPVFVNHETGEIRVEDPRLGELPKGWRRVPHDKDHCWTMFGNLETGRRGWEDPRLEPDALRERGVNLQEFVLV